MRNLMEMRSKTPPMVPIANPNQDLIHTPLAESKAKEIGREEFNEKSSFHQELPPFFFFFFFFSFLFNQELPPRTPIRGEIGFLDEGTARREFYCEGGGVINHYERFFRQIRGGRRVSHGDQGKHRGITTTAILEEEEAIEATTILDKVINKYVNEKGKRNKLAKQRFERHRNQVNETERKTVKASLVSIDVGVYEDGNVESEIHDIANTEFSKDKVDIKLMKPKDSKDEIQIFGVTSQLEIDCDVWEHILFQGKVILTVSHDESLMAMISFVFKAAAQYQQFLQVVRVSYD
ncbi:hypothetical protein M5K25_017531 [Dendrobium thyrsiflorum]|uniref:Uncharacterized protein n=1 Tax=Dendrobium thyrsiflorum TaxID=117978 RepID=A0ABD0UN80_DENTH